MTASDFATAALATGLITQAMLEYATVSLSNDGRGASDEALADWLVESECLTPYQVSQIKLGRRRLAIGGLVVVGWADTGRIAHVFRACQLSTGSLRALKVLELDETGSGAQIMAKSVQLSAQISHSNFVRTFFGFQEGNHFYHVMQDVAGASLRHYRHAQGLLPIKKAAATALGIASLLHKLHEMGILYRTLDSGDVLLNNAEDFFLTPSVNMCRLGDLAPLYGTVGPDFRAPEMLQEPNQAECATDVYGLGCLLYYMVTGKAPYPGGRPKDKIRRILSDVPYHPKKFNSAVSTELADLMADMLEKRPGGRPSLESIRVRLAALAE